MTCTTRSLSTPTLNTAALPWHSRSLDHPQVPRDCPNPTHLICILLKDASCAEYLDNCRQLMHVHMSLGLIRYIEVSAE